MNRLNPFTNVSAVEADLEKYCTNYYVPKSDAQLFAMIDTENYYPVETRLDSNGNFVVEDTPEAIGMDLYLGTKRQFLYQRYDITSNSYKIELGITFKTGWNPDNYLVFQNGYLLNSVLYQIYCPSFTSTYTKKVIYNRNMFRKGDYIDIFYIEADDRFKNIKFNHDVYIRYVKFTCEVSNQIVVQIPYPYAGYPRVGEMFFVFDNQTKRYLSKGEDYDVETLGHYILMRKDYILSVPNEDSITFVFPYCQADNEAETSSERVGEETGTSFRICSYQWIPLNPGDTYPANPVIEFTPAFKSYPLTKNNFLLFCNSTYVHPDRYQVVDNSHIRLRNAIDIAKAEFDKYTMVIYEETDPSARKYRSFELDVHVVIPTMNGQPSIPIPTVKPPDANFLVFNGSLMFDVSNKFTWNKATNCMDVNDTAAIRAGREIIFIFYTNVVGRKRRRLMKLVKIKFVSSSDGSVYMTNTAGYSIDFNKKNCIIFMNGTYLDPDKYDITNNTLTFTNPLDKLRKHKAFTGCYLVSRELESYNVNIMDEIREGYPNKLLWFDERKTKPIIEEVEVPI